MQPILKHKSDLRPLSFNLAYFVVLFAAWSTPLGWITLPLVATLCLLTFLGAVQNHNAIHAPIFSNRWFNKGYQVVLTLVFGHMSSAYVPGHNLSHHMHLESPKDVMRTSKARFKINIFNILTFMLLTLPATTKGDSAYFKMMRKAHPRWFKQLVLETGILFACHAIALSLDWKKALVLWFLPHVYAAWGIVGFNLLQHDGTDPKHAYNHSRNFVGKLVNWITFNNGYHAIHHLQPTLHWSEAPAAHDKLIKPFIHPNLNQPSLLKYLFQCYILNQRLDFHGKPVVLGPKKADEPWIPSPQDTKVDLGAEFEIAA